MPKKKRVTDKVTVPIPVPEGFIPKVGDVIYVDTSLHLSHGSDDVEGGLAEVVRVEIDQEGKRRGSNQIFVETRQHPGHFYGWEILADEQERLRKEFGSSWAYENPDDSPEFNRWD